MRISSRHYDIVTEYTPKGWFARIEKGRHSFGCCSHPEPEQSWAIDNAAFLFKERYPAQCDAEFDNLTETLFMLLF